MKKYGRVLRYGFGSWLLIFLSSLALDSLKSTHRELFESLMSTIVVAWTVGLTIGYFANIRRSHMPEGVSLGLSFLAVNLVSDLCVFMWGPMKMAFSDYIADIGVAYLSMPVITIGFAYAIRRSRRARQKDAEVARVESEGGKPDDESTNARRTSKKQNVQSVG